MRMHIGTAEQRYNYVICQKLIFSFVRMLGY